MKDSCYIRNVDVVDVVRGEVAAGQHVVIRGETIESISNSPVSFEGPAFDGTGLYLCPGLIDCHVHFFWDSGEDPRICFIESNDEERLECGTRNARLAIQSGITTMRDCAAPGPLIFELKRRIANDETPGPHVIACGYALTRPKGHCHFMGGEIDSIESALRLIEWNLEQGAGFVKLMASGGGLTPGTVPHEPELALDIMKAAAEAAHANGVQITAHCHATESIDRAVDAGLDMIEHVNFVEPPGRYCYDESITLRIRDEGIVVSPTVFIALQTAKQFQVRGTAHNPQNVAAIERLTGRLDNARRFHELGMKIIGGTDCGAADTPFNSIVDEILTYTQAGMSNAEALRSITSNGASYMNLDGVGQVAEGFRADLLLLREDPLGNLDALKTPAKVFKSGRLEYED